MAAARIVLGALLLTVSGAGSAQAPVWRISETAGNVTITHGGRSRPAVRGALLATGSTIATAASARAVLVRGGEFVIVAPGSRVRVADPAQQRGGLVQMLADFGTALFRIERRATPHFSVLTPFLAATVKGTVFTVTVGPAGGTVQVTEGAVEVATLDGGAVQLLRPGMIATVSATDLHEIQVEGESSSVVRSSVAPAPTSALVGPAAPPPPPTAIIAGPIGSAPSVVPQSSPIRLSYDFTAPTAAVGTTSAAATMAPASAVTGPAAAIAGEIAPLVTSLTDPLVPLSAPAAAPAPLSGPVLALADPLLAPVTTVAAGSGETLGAVVEPVIGAVDPLVAPIAATVVAPVLAIADPLVAPIAGVIEPVLAAADPLLAPVAGAVLDPVVAGVVTPVLEPVVAAVATPVLEPVVDAVVTPVLEPVVSLATPVLEPVLAPVVTPVLEPVLTPIITPVLEPVVTPVLEPVLEPVPTPIVTPLLEPLISPPATETPVPAPPGGGGGGGLCVLGICLGGGG